MHEQDKKFNNNNKNKKHKKKILTPIRMIAIKKTSGNKCCQGYGEKGTLCSLGENVTWYSHYEKEYGRSSKN